MNPVESYPRNTTCRSTDDEGREEVHQYQLLRKLAVGGQAEVFEAIDLGSPGNPKVAIKRLKADYSETAPDEVPVEVKRFLREARIASRVDHPHVMRVLDFGTDDEGNLLYVMPYVRNGITLGDLIDDRKAKFERGLRKNTLTGLITISLFDPEEEIALLFNQMLDAVEALHKKGLIHRDLKPANFLGVKRQGKLHLLLSDFGIARCVDARSTALFGGTLTAEGGMVGTPNYMAPEQFMEPRKKMPDGLSRPFKADKYTDVFALGVIFYELVTGKRPFDRPFDEKDEDQDMSFPALQTRIVEDDPPAYSRSVSNACPEYELFNLRLLAKKPWDRPASIEEVRKLFHEAIEARIRRMSRRSYATTGKSAPALVEMLNTPPPMQVPESVKALPRTATALRPAQAPDQATPAIARIPTPVLNRRPSSRAGFKVIAGLVLMGGIGAGAWYATVSRNTATDPTAGSNAPGTASTAVKSASPSAASSSAQRHSSVCPEKGAPDDANWQKAQKGSCQAVMLYGNLTVAKYQDCAEAHLIIAKCKIKTGKAADVCTNLLPYAALDAPPLPADLQKVFDAKCAPK